MTILLNNLIEIAVTLLTTVMTAVVIPQIVAYLKSKTNSNKLQSALRDLEETVDTSVNFISQTVIKQLKADGKWDKEAQEAALKGAVGAVIKGLTFETIDYIENHSGSIVEVITRRVESKVFDNKIYEKEQNLYVK